MPDWIGEARRKLANSKLSASEREEISRELAGYLEDLCADAPAGGLDDCAAGQVHATQAAAELYEDQHLGAHLYRARRENSMNVNDRTKRLWLPGLAALLMAEGVLYSVQLERLALHFVVGPAHRWYVGVNLPWLCALPLLGALSAYWSRRQGAGRAMQAAAGLFPFLLFVGSFFGEPGVGVLPIRIGFGEHPWAVYQLMAMYIPWILVGWVCIPLTALLLGVLPVLLSSASPRREAALES